MRFIKDIENDLVNLAVIEHIFLLNKGPDYPERFHIMAASASHEYLIKKFRSESAANGFMRRLYEGCKLEIGE